jgi:hypothetical protein
MPRLIRTLVVLGCLVIPVACNDPGNPLPGVDVSLSVSSSIIRDNETITVTTTFQNIGWREAFVPSKSCGPLFSVIAADGQPLELWAGPCSLELPPPLRLRPGERAQFTGTWDGRDRHGIRTPGDYRLAVRTFGGNAVVVRVLE